MIALLILTGVLMGVSGLVTIRTATRMNPGVPVLSLLEIVAGGVLVVVAMFARPTPDGGFRLVVGGVSVVVVLSVAQAWRVAARRREREDSEARRLVTYVKYLAGTARGSHGKNPPADRG